MTKISEGSFLFEFFVLSSLQELRCFCFTVKLHPIVYLGRTSLVLFQQCQRQRIEQPTVLWFGTKLIHRHLTSVYPVTRSRQKAVGIRQCSSFRHTKRQLPWESQLMMATESQWPIKCMTLQKSGLMCKVLPRSANLAAFYIFGSNRS